MRLLFALGSKLLRPDFIGRIIDRVRYEIQKSSENGQTPGRVRLKKHEAKMSSLMLRSKSERLAGKVAIITGAGSGLGRSMAMLFAQAGAIVIVAEINDDAGCAVRDEIVAAGGKATFIHTDVTSDTSVEAMIALVKETHRHIDILVNNAGMNVIGSVLTVGTERWQAGLDLNLTAVYRCCRAVVPHMVGDGTGAILIIASVQGVAGFGDSSVYAATKGGLISLTRQLAMDMALRRVRVNSISPGVIITPIFDSLANRMQMFETVSNYTPLGHPGVPEDVSFAALFLVSDESSYMTGTNLIIDGGMTVRGI